MVRVTPEKPAAHKTESDDFFIPELCQSESLFTLIVVAQLFSLILVMAESSTHRLDWERLGIVSLFVQWNILLSAAALCRLRPFLIPLHPALAGIISCLLVSMLCIACTGASFYLGLAESSGLEQEMTLYLRNGLIALIISTLVLHHFYLKSLSRFREQAELKMRLSALQARIRPHFLFNTLNSIASLIAIDPQKAEQAILDLSDLFRATLTQPDAMSTWASELLMGQRYLSIEQYRFGDRLRIQWDIDDIPEDIPMPVLTLQPLLENAIIHGIQKEIRGGTVEAHASCVNGLFQLCIRNPCSQDPRMTRSAGTRQGLDNISARLQGLFGKQAYLHTSWKDGIFETSLRYPYPKGPEESAR